MKSIFIAEGEKHVLSALRLGLELQTGFEISGEARHSEALLAQVCQRPPDVILLDWDLLGLHPQRLLDTLREHCPGTQILVTGIKPEQEQSTRTYGVDGFLSKQLPPERFMAALQALVFEPKP